MFFVQKKQGEWVSPEADMLWKKLKQETASSSCVSTSKRVQTIQNLDLLLCCLLCLNNCEAPRLGIFALLA